MRRKFAIFLISSGIICSAFYMLYAEDDFPDIVFNSLQILKKPLEELLPDLSEPENAEAIQSTTLDLQNYQDLQNQREKWNEMRRLIEAGQPLFGPLPSEIAVSTSPIGRLAPAVPPPPGFTVQLPYESRLSVSGRKTIGMLFRSTKYSNAGYATTQGVSNAQSSFELQQSLQVRINGQIGRKVTVNVDFDDTKTDKKDISIVYVGDPEEVVQRAAFGDINMSLPQTEFAGYSKQVFGASAEVKYKAMKAYAIGSRTKGQTETKEFVGNVILQRLNIPDTSYIRRRFYNYKDLSGGANDNNVSIPTMQVFLDTQDTTRAGPQYSTRTVDLTLIPNRPASAPTEYTGRFLLLAQGVDYFVDPSSGIITFRNTLTNISVVAIDYIIPGNGQLSSSRGQTVLPNGAAIKAIKWDESQITEIPSTEELTHYNVGASKIVRDNNQGNFILQLRDLGNNNIGPSVGVQYLPNNSGQIVMDFEAGTFALTRRLDNEDPGSSYAPVYYFSPTTQSSFFIEFRARVKTYTLRPNIVINSERITLDGRTLVRDVDYFLDYASGFLTFFNEDQITETSRVQATYDFSPFGIAGAQQDTLVGARGEVSMAPVHPILASSLIGSTIIYDFAPKQTAAPDIRQTSGSWLVQEADVHFNDLIFNFLPSLKTTISGEVARSVRNPNTFGKALIENMEGIKDESLVSLSKLSWQIAANPSFVGGQFLNSIGQVSLVNQVGDNLTNNLVNTLAINPNAAALSGDQTQVLTINYDLSVSQEASVATVLRTGGIDFSKKQYLEMWVMGDGTSGSATPSETEVNVTLGQISEQFDGVASLKTEDGNGNNTLDADEDVGIAFVNPDASVSTLGASNLRVDSNDLDRNGVLNSENTSIGGNVGYSATLLPAPIAPIRFDETLPDNRIDFTGWKFVRIPLNISTTTASNWSAVKELRISLKPGGTATKTGTIHVAKIAVVGNRWLTEDPTVLGSTISVAAINTEDDQSYVSPAGHPDFDDLNQVNTALTGPTPTRRKEQSLAINYDFVNASGTVLTKNVTISPMDFTSYGALKFFVRKSSATPSSNQNANVVFRAGSDTDYWEFSYPLDALTEDVWTELQVNQVGGVRPTAWVSGSPGGSVRSVGSPNLSSIAQLKFGVENPTQSTISGQIWVNELHASDVISRTGYASVLKTGFDLYGWGSLTGSARNIDRNFETFTSAITNQDRREQTATLSLTRLTWFPMSFTGTQRHTITPAINTINSNLISVQQEGDVREKNMGAQGTLQLPRMPKFAMNYDKNKIVTSQLYRTDKTDNYGVVMDYAVPINSRALPRNITLGYKASRLKLNFENGALAGASDPFSVSDTRTDTSEVTAKLTFQPANGFTFNPNFSRTITHEAKDVIFSTNTSVHASTQTIEYDRLRTQTMGFDGVLGFRKWFSPRMRFTITNRETFGIPLVSNLAAADRKTVDRTSTAETGWDFAWRDFTRRLRPLQSMNVVTTYLVEDGDSWKDVSGGFNSLNSITIRDRLGSGERTNLTIRETIRSTQRLSPFDWAQWVGPGRTMKTMSLTSTISDTRQRQETTGTPTRIHTQIFPDLLLGFTQTEHLFSAQRWMSNSQLNLKTQFKKVDTENVSLQKASSNGGDWRFTMFRKLDLFTTYTQTTDSTFDRINQVTTSDTHGSVFGLQLGFNVGKWRLSPKYDQTKRETEDAAGRLTADLRTRTAALQAYADLYLPAGIKLPFADLVVFSNRIRTTENISVEQRRSSIDELNSNTDTYKFSTTNDYEMTSNVRLSFGGSYFYTANKVSADANTYGYEVNSLLTIQF